MSKKQKGIKSLFNRSQKTGSDTVSSESQSFLVIGLGRFGSSVAETLVNYGYDVLAVDSNIERIQHLSTEIPHIVQLDSTNEAALRKIDVERFDTALVAISNNFESSIITTALLLQFGLRKVIAKARTRLQKQILERIGAHEVILPEHDVGIRLARRLASNHMIDYLEMRGGFGMVELMAPPQFWGKSLIESNMRQKFGLTLIAIHREHEFIVNPDPHFHFKEGDILAVVGRIKDAERMQG